MLTLMWIVGSYQRVVIMALLQVAFMTHLAIPFAQNGHNFLYSPTIVCYKLLEVSFLLHCEMHLRNCKQ